MLRTLLFISLCGLALLGAAQSQTVTIGRNEPQRDVQLEESESLLGRALFLRCFCADNNLGFDAQGRPAGAPKATDWTLAGVNVLKAERKSPNLIEFQGVRVAVRFIPERREFERHPQNDEKLRIQIADTGDAKQFQRALDAVFAQGIDPGLQRAMPDYWRHYFDPLLPWPTDAFAGQSVYVPGAAGQLLDSGLMLAIKSDIKGLPVASPALTHRSEASYTAEASKDRVKGGVLLRLVVDADGMPKRIQVTRPLGYGLDERAVEAAGKYRFTPAMRDGKPVAAVLMVNEDFVTQ